METYSLVNGRKVIYSSNSFDHLLDAVRELSGRGYGDLYYISTHSGRLVFMDFMPGDEEPIFRIHDIEIICEDLGPNEAAAVRKMIGWPFIVATARAMLGAYPEVAQKAITRIQDARKRVVHI